MRAPGNKKRSGNLADLWHSKTNMDFGLRKPNLGELDTTLLRAGLYNLLNGC